MSRLEERLLILLSAITFGALSFLLGHTIVNLVMFFSIAGMVLVITLWLLDSDSEAIHLNVGTDRVGFAFLVVTALLTTLVLLGYHGAFLVTLAAFAILELPGFALLRLVGIDFGPLIDTLIVSCGISFGLDGFVLAPIFLLNSTQFRSYLVVALLVLSLVSCLKWASSPPRKSRTLTIDVSRFDLGCAILVTWTFILFYMIEYPLASGYPFDIATIASKSFTFSRGIFSLSPYPLFLLTQGSIQSLAGISSDSLSLFKLGIGAVGFVLIPAFFVMGKSLVPESMRNVRSLSAVLFSLGGGIGWLWLFLSNGLSEIGNFNLSSLTLGQAPTGNDLIYAGNLSWFSFYRPETMAALELMISIYLLRSGMGNRNFALTFPLVLAGMVFSHVPEFVFLLLLIFGMQAIRGRFTLIPRRTLFLTVGITCVLSSFASLYTTPYISQAYLLAIAGAFFLLEPNLDGVRPKLLLKLQSLSRFRNALVQLAILSAVSLFLEWLFSYQGVKSDVAIPLSIYPVVLGTPLFLFLAHFRKPSREEDNGDFFLLWLTVAFLMASFISLLNFDFFTTSYYEYRMLPLIFTGLLIPTSYEILSLVGRSVSFRRDRGELA